MNMNAAVLSILLDECVAKSNELFAFATDEFTKNGLRGALVSIVSEQTLRHELQQKLSYIPRSSLTSSPEVIRLIDTYDPTSTFVLVGIMLSSKKGQSDIQYRLVTPDKHGAHSSVRVCANCKHASCTLLLCGKCKAIEYCSKQCQILHWKKEHKARCLV